MRILRSTASIAASCQVLFGILEDPRQADRLHPEFLRIQVERAPWLPRPGERTWLVVTLRGVAYRLVTEVAEYRRGFFLLERQVEGPFAAWEHAVHLEEEAQGMSKLTEIVTYQPSHGWLGQAFDWLVLRHDMAATLAHRRERLHQLVSAERVDSRQSTVDS